LGAMRRKMIPHAPSFQPGRFVGFFSTSQQMSATQVPSSVAIRPSHCAPLIVILESRCGIGYKFHIGFNVLRKRRSLLKLAFSARVGGNYNSISVAWQWSWIGRPN
jgi:hypothetical protein